MVQKLDRTPQSIHRLDRKSPVPQRRDRKSLGRWGLR